jgi:hypothetical protein
LIGPVQSSSGGATVSFFFRLTFGFAVFAALSSLAPSRALALDAGFRGGSSVLPLVALPSAASAKPLKVTLSQTKCTVKNCSEKKPLVAKSSNGFAPNSSVYVSVLLPDGRDGNGASSSLNYAPYAATNGKGSVEFRWWVRPTDPNGKYLVTFSDGARDATVSFTVSGNQAVTPAAEQTIITNNTIAALDTAGRPYLLVDSDPIGIRPLPTRDAGSSIAKVGHNISLVAVCQVTNGQLTTEANFSITGDDRIEFISNVWYGIKLEDGKVGYIPDAWTTRTNGLGLKECTVAPL